MRKLDDIIPPSRRASPVEAAAPSSGSPPPRRRFPWMTLLLVLVVIALCIGALFYFSGARVEVTPATAAGTASGSFTATERSGALPFQIITAQKTDTQTVPANGTKIVSQAAQGTITIYNTQSKTQRLIANTRFETTSGLVFRIHSALSVPAALSNGPGSVTTTVYADQPGSQYNAGPSSFTLPGLSGTPQFNKVYAKSTAAMTGGASGTVPVVNAGAETSARSALVGQLGPELTNQLAAEVPAGFVLLTGAATTTYQALETKPSSTSGSADVQEQGTITAVVFPNVGLAEALAPSLVGPSYQGEPVKLLETTSLRLNASTLPRSSDRTFSFSLSGTASILFTIDPARIAAAVAGKTRAGAEVVLSNYPEIKRAVLILRPFWKTTFPEDPSAITVVVGNPS